MEQPDRPIGLSDEEWAKRKLESDIAAFKNAVEDSEVVEVDEPSTYKDIEIAWEDSSGFHHQQGKAHGLYRDGDVYHIDWMDDRGRMTVEKDTVVTLEESDYKEK